MLVCVCVKYECMYTNILERKPEALSEAVTQKYSKELREVYMSVSVCMCVYVMNVYKHSREQA